MKLPVLSIEGKELRSLEVDESVFGITPNGPVLHQAYVRQRNNQRAGTSSTKTRAEVQGSTRKIRPQKGTGRARAGTVRSPTRVGGGIVFGPKPRDYSQAMPKKMRRLAIRSALSGKVADGQLVVIDSLSFEKPKTKEIVRILGNVGLKRSALVVTADSDRGVLASLRNLEKTKAIPAAYLNVADMMNHAGLLMTEEAVRVAEGLWGKKAAATTTVKPKSARGEVDEKTSETLRGRAARRATYREEQVVKAAATKATADAEKAEKAKAKAEKAPKADASADAEVIAEAPTEKPAKVKAEKPAKAEAEEATEVEAVAAPEVVVEPEAAAEPETAAEAPAEEKPKKAPRAKKEAPEAEASSESAEKPKRAPRAKKVDAGAPAEGSTEEKPKRAPRAKKTEGSE